MNTSDNGLTSFRPLSPISMKTDILPALFFVATVWIHHSLIRRPVHHEKIIPEASRARSHERFNDMSVWYCVCVPLPFSLYVRWFPYLYHLFHHHHHSMARCLSYGPTA